MRRILTYIEAAPSDICQSIGQTLLYPFSQAFGHSFQIISSKEIKRLDNPCSVDKIIAAFLSFVFLPFVFVSGLIGATFLLFSQTHKDQFAGIESVCSKYLSNPPIAKARIAEDNFTPVFD